MADEVRARQRAEEEDRERQRRAASGVFETLCADIDALAPEVCSACDELNLKKARVKQRFGLTVSGWAFALRLDYQEFLRILFLPDGQWEFLDRTGERVVPKTGRLYFFPGGDASLSGEGKKGSSADIYFMPRDRMRALIMGELQRRHG